MLCLSASLLNQPILSLRTGGAIARVTAPIFNPRSLKVEGFYCDDHQSKEPLVLLYQDIREFSPRGFIVNDHDVLAHPDDLVRLRSVLELNFELLGKQVETVSGERVGRVNEYAVETTTMYVQKLYLAQSFLKNLMGGSLSVDRSQIVEITSRRIIVHDLLRGTPATAAASAS